MDSVQDFLIPKKSSYEHTIAISRMSGLPRMVVFILKHELDSMLRAIYFILTNNLK